MNINYRQTEFERDIYREVIDRNVYQVSAFSHEDVVVDVGMHVGMFSCLALEKGAGVLYGFEANQDNFTMAERNVNQYKAEIHLYKVAIWRSDIGETTLHFENKEQNSGSGNVFAQQGETVTAIGLDNALRHVPKVRFLKIDAEGSEYPILYTADLSKIEEIAAEFHRVDITTIPKEAVVKRHEDDYSPEKLSAYIESKGFIVTSYVRPDDVNLVMFHAKQR